MSQHERIGRAAGAGVAGPFAVECPRCRAHLAVTIGLVGRVASCPGCGAAFRVPAPPEVHPSEPPRDVTAAVPDDAPVAWQDPPLPVTRQRRDEPAGAPAGTLAPAAASVGIVEPVVVAAVAPATPAAAETAPAGDAAATGLSFREPVKTIRSGGAEIELRRLTEEERRTRRARRSLLLLVVGAALLVALVLILSNVR